MNLITYWTYIGIILLILFIPGFAIANRFKNLSTIEKLGVSFGFSFSILAILVPFFAFKLDFLARLLFAGIMIASLWYLLNRRSELKFEIDAKFLLFVLVISLVSRYFLQTLWEYPVMGGDWFGHAFERPFRFETGNWSPERDRTLLFSIVIYAGHKLLGISLYQYWFSQIISVAVNSVYIIPAYLIAKKAFGEWVAKTSALFMLVTPFLIFNTLYTWPKNAAMYCVLMMIYFLFFSEHDIKLRYPLAGFFAGLGFWFHNYAVFYVGIAVLLLIYKEKMYRGLLSKNCFENLKRFSYFLAALLLVLAPYLAWMYSYYGTFSTTRFIYYPFATTYALATDGTPREILNTFHETPINELVTNRLVNAIVTLTPAALPINPIARSFPTYNPIYYYSHDYPGALSFLMYLAVLIWFLRYILGKRKTDMVLVSFLVLPLVINLILWGWRDWGLVGQILHPTIPILIMLGINEVGSINNLRLKTLFTYFMFTGALVEGVIYSRLILDFYKIEGGRAGVSKMGLGFIPDFQISNFVSAHFFLNSYVDLLGGFLISIGIIILVYIFLYGKVKNN
jgi:hypothetical protein